MKARVIGPWCWRGCLRRAFRARANTTILTLALRSSGIFGPKPKVFSRLHGRIIVLSSVVPRPGEVGVRTQFPEARIGACKSGRRKRGFASPSHILFGLRAV